jgi:PII-like signaling protein
MMQSSQPAMMLRIYTDEMALSGDHPLHEVVLGEARAAGLAGGTVFKALDGFGRSAHHNTHHGHDLASDVPLVIEIVDAEENIRRFLPLLERLTEVGLITLTPLYVVRFDAPPAPREGAR